MKVVPALIQRVQRSAISCRKKVAAKKAPNVIKEHPKYAGSHVNYVKVSLSLGDY